MQKTTSTKRPTTVKSPTQPKPPAKVASRDLGNKQKVLNKQKNLLVKQVQGANKAKALIAAPKTVRKAGVIGNFESRTGANTHVAHTREMGTDSHFEIPKNMRGGVEHGKPRNPMNTAKMRRALTKGELPICCERYVKLLDHPFTAEWGEEDEPFVRCPIYTTLVPPGVSSTMRCYGTMDFVISPAHYAWGVISVGPGNIQRHDNQNSGENWAKYGPTSHYTAVRVSDTPTFTNWNFGTPYDGLSPGGCAMGYFYETNGVAECPNCNPRDNRLIGSGAATTGPSIMAWANTTTVGTPAFNDWNQYNYRPVAGGVRVIPLDPVADVGGVIEAWLIPEPGADTYATTHSVGPTSNALMSLPDHVIKRGTDTFEARWLPGSLDYDFYQVENRAGGMSDVTGFYCANARLFIRITPGDIAAATRYRIQYVSFYEIAGSMVQADGSVPYTNVPLGSKIATAIQNVTQTDLDADVRVNQVKSQTNLEVIKDHPNPAIGKIVEGAKDVKEATGILDDIEGFFKEALPIAGGLLPLLL